MALNISQIQDIYSKAREKNVIPGAYRLQNLLNENDFIHLTNIPTILVGGTNGKGSTCAYLESIFRHFGLKTGLYTSPHLTHPTERVRVSGQPVSEDSILKAILHLTNQEQSKLQDLSFFELMTASAFTLFVKEKVDIIICEVGLGGKFDSTNVLAPSISVLTSVSYDHTHILGTTLKQIACDKAHIARRHRPFIINNEEMPNEALISAKTIASKIGSKVIFTSNKLSQTTQSVYKHFAHIPYKKNLKTALMVIDVFKDDYSNLLLQYGLNFEQKKLIEAIKNTFWPGRFDVRTVGNKILLFDSAHNPDGVKFFIKEYSRSKYNKSKFHLIFASFSDKDWQKSLALIAQFAHTISLANIQNERGVQNQQIFAYLQTKNLHSKVNCISNLQKGLIEVLFTQSSDLFVIIGSIAFIGEVFESLKLDVFKA